MHKTRNEIAINLIDPDPEQPRQHFDAAGIADLAASIAANGLAVPILLRPVGERYVIVHGERRWRAARSLGWLTIPADVRDVTPDEARWLALAENVQRADLSPIEEGRAYQRRLSEGMTQAQLAARIGKDRTYIAQKLRLLTLPAPLLFFVDRKHLNEGHARQLLRLKGMYPDGLARSFGHWTDDKIAAFEFKTADRVFAWSMLREIRPEDNPVWWFSDLLTDKSGPAPDWLSEGCDRFLADVRAHEYSVPQWLVAAFWWACLAIDLELSVSNLQITLTGWQDRFYAAVAFMAWRGEKPSAATGSPQERMNWLEWWGYWADLRHTGALEWARMTPADDTDAGRDKRIEVFEHVLSQESYALPSTLQPWGTARQEYEALRMQTDDVYAVLDDVSRDTHEVKL